MKANALLGLLAIVTALGATTKVMGADAKPAATRSSAAASQPAIAPAGLAAAPVAQDGEVVPSDLLEVVISDLFAPGLSTRFSSRVDDQTRVTLPLIGPLGLKGLTLMEAAQSISGAYRAANLLPRAQVILLRTESGAAPSMKWGPIAAGDFVRVQILDLVRPGVISVVTRRVAPDGTLPLPQVGTPKMSGLTEAQAQRVVTVAYRAANLMPNALNVVQRISADEASRAPALEQEITVRSISTITVAAPSNVK